MTKLKQIETDKIQNYLPKEDVKPFIKSKEMVFELPRTFNNSEPNPLINVEISLRRCKRVGLFTE